MTKIDVPNENLAVITTYFEMCRKPVFENSSSSLILTTWDEPDLLEYRTLFRKVGEDWLWFGRLLLNDDELRSAIHAPEIEIFKVQHDGHDIGFVELDFSKPEQCEIYYFGLIPEMNGRGYGPAMMTETLKRAWKDDVKRVWLHTCTNDSQRASNFYQRSGFIAYKREVDMHADPRLTGHLPMDAGPHVPIISGKDLSNI